MHGISSPVPLNVLIVGVLLHLFQDSKQLLVLKEIRLFLCRAEHLSSHHWLSPTLPFLSSGGWAHRTGCGLRVWAWRGTSPASRNQFLQRAHGPWPGRSRRGGEEWVGWASLGLVNPRGSPPPNSCGSAWVRLTSLAMGSSRPEPTLWNHLWRLPHRRCQARWLESRCAFTLLPPLDPPATSQQHQGTPRWSAHSLWFRLFWVLLGKLTFQMFCLLSTWEPWSLMVSSSIRSHLLGVSQRLLTAQVCWWKPFSTLLLLSFQWGLKKHEKWTHAYSAIPTKALLLFFSTSACLRAVKTQGHPPSPAVMSAHSDPLVQLEQPLSSPPASRPALCLNDSGLMFLLRPVGAVGPLSPFLCCGHPEVGWPATHHESL